MQERQRSNNACASEAQATRQPSSCSPTCLRHYPQDFGEQVTEVVTGSVPRKPAPLFVVDAADGAWKLFYDADGQPDLGDTWQDAVT